MLLEECLIYRKWLINVSNVVDDDEGNSYDHKHFDDDDALCPVLSSYQGLQFCNYFVSALVTSASPPVCHSHWHLNVMYIFLFLYVFVSLPHHTFSNTLTANQMSTTIPQNLIFVKNPNNIYVAKSNWLWLYCSFLTWLLHPFWSTFFSWFLWLNPVLDFLLLLLPLLPGFFDDFSLHFVSIKNLC